jgi:tetratricopeptide (TPR) repeat protein
MPILMVLIFIPFGFTEASDEKSINVKIDQADSLYAQRNDPEKVKAAIKLYESVLSEKPDNIEAQWKLSRILYWLGVHSPSKEDKRVIFKRAIDLDKSCLETDMESVPCHYWLGVNYAVYGDTKGILKSLSLVEPLKEEMNAVIARDEEYDQGGAYVVLGRVSFKLPWIVGGSKSESVKLLKKALEIAPNNTLAHLFLASTYLGMKEMDLAKKELDFIVNTPDNDNPDDMENKASARKLLQKHFP